MNRRNAPSSSLSSLSVFDQRGRLRSMIWKKDSVAVVRYSVESFLSFSRSNSMCSAFRSLFRK